ncbi:MAG: GDSL-type esterase/lipase family protein [Candidatus Omnitrophota bacterium]
MPVKKKLLLVTFGVLSALLVMEVILFCFSFWAPHLSENPIIKQGQEKALKVLCLGDSFTYGIGAEFNQSYPAQLEQILQRGINKEVMVINGGISSANSAIVLEKMKTFLKYIEPDIIIVTTGKNDIWNYKQLKHYGDWKVQVKAFFSQSRVYNLLFIAQINIKNTIRGIKLKQQSKRKKDSKGSSNFDEEGLDKANDLRSAKLFDSAISMYKQILKKYPTNVAVLLEMGRCYRLDGQDNQAVTMLRRALILDESNQDILNELIAIFVNKKSLKQKKEFFYKLSLLLPENKEIKKQLISANMQLADMYYKSGDNYNAIVYYNKAICLDPYNAQIYNRVYYNKAIGLEHKQDILTATGIKWQGQTIWQITFDNISQIAEICKRKGIVLIFSGYPEEMYDPVNTAARKYDVILVDHRKLFAGKKAMGQRSKYFVSDGHCTRYGYQLMAENIATQILKYLENKL